MNKYILIVALMTLVGCGGSGGKSVEPQPEPQPVSEALLIAENNMGVINSIIMNPNGSLGGYVELFGVDEQSISTYIMNQKIDGIIQYTVVVDFQTFYTQFEMESTLTSYGLDVHTPANMLLSAMCREDWEGGTYNGIPLVISPELENDLTGMILETDDPETMIRFQVMIWYAQDTGGYGKTKWCNQ